MRTKEAMEVLGLDKAACDLTPLIIQSAFRQRVKSVHPDTADDSTESTMTVQQLTMAKKVLLESLDGTDLSCRLCNGRGIVRSSMGFRQCVACKGTGDKR